MREWIHNVSRTVPLCTFFLIAPALLQADPDFASLSIAGNFNGWNTTADPLTETTPGTWDTVIHPTTPDNKALQLKILADQNWEGMNWGAPTGSHALCTGMTLSPRGENLVLPLTNHARLHVRFQPDRNLLFICPDNPIGSSIERLVLAGTLNGWDLHSTILTNNQQGLLTTVIYLEPKPEPFQFKFFNPDLDQWWGGRLTDLHEQVPSSGFLDIAQGHNISLEISEPGHYQVAVELDSGKYFVKKAPPQETPPDNDGRLTAVTDADPAFEALFKDLAEAELNLAKLETLIKDTPRRKPSAQQPAASIPARQASPSPAPAVPEPRAVASRDNYIAGEDDITILKPGQAVNVNVVVAGKEEISEARKRIDDAGMISLPLIGEVKAGGLTLRELKDHLQARYSETYVEPQVILDFAYYEYDGLARLDYTTQLGQVSPWGFVTVMGKVKAPGKIPIPPTRDLTVTGAIQLSGGLERAANRGRIRVSRQLAQGEVQRFSVDLDDIAKKGEVEQDILLKPGDVIFIPETFF